MEEDKREPLQQDDDRDLTYWTELVHGVAEASRQVDKLVTTLAAGALGLSIAFIRDITPNPSCNCILAASWGSLCLALVLTLTSLVTSGIAHEKILGQLKEGTPIEDIDPNSEWTRATRWLARASILALVAGLALLSSFALVNLK